MSIGESCFATVCALIVLLVSAGSFHACHETKQAKVLMIREGVPAAEANCLLHAMGGGTADLICDRVFERAAR